jgi:hypothetical protein
MTSTVLFMRGKNDGIAVYVPKEAILKETAAKIKLSQHFFFDLVWELSNRASYNKDYAEYCSKANEIVLPYKEQFHNFNTVYSQLG